MKHAWAVPALVVIASTATCLLAGCDRKERATTYVPRGTQQNVDAPGLPDSVPGGTDAPLLDPSKEPAAIAVVRLMCADRADDAMAAYEELKAIHSRSHRMDSIFELAGAVTHDWGPRITFVGVRKGMQEQFVRYWFYRGAGADAQADYHHQRALLAKDAWCGGWNAKIITMPLDTAAIRRNALIDVFAGRRWFPDVILSPLKEHVKALEQDPETAADVVGVWEKAENQGGAKPVSDKVERAHRDFLAEAVADLCLHNKKELSEACFVELQQKHPGEYGQRTLDQHIGIATGDCEQDTDIDTARQNLRMLLTTAYLHYGLGFDDVASYYERRAVHLLALMKAIEGVDERTVPGFEQARQSTLIDIMSGIEPTPQSMREALEERLRKELGEAEFNTLLRKAGRVREAGTGQ